MNIDPATHRLDSVRYVPSPNHDLRPRDERLELVVVHGISLPPGEFGGTAIERFFTNDLDPAEHPYFDEIRDLRVSAHVVIYRDGSVTQFVPFDRRAWHAGQSRYGERTRCNDFSIGIELEGTDTEPYTAVQYEVLGQVLAAIKHAYPTVHAVRGHSDIAPGRKIDPGPAFDWGHLASRLPDGLATA
ncbi:1,6-anhydro-N-acetylmuramyl-L-alanine amidase AmpD [Guyparkeria halopsychrophila]|uniref:1,6-anhydro-N-acetylmuramyl-L-alanine amidase AmpD n=1 Tax=Guyparkeria halopsychrophila TaxID=3139421 RepID=UPI0037C93623